MRNWKEEFIVKKNFLIDFFLCLLKFLRKKKSAENFFLSSPKSGTNLTLASLSLIVRKPVGSISGRFHYNNNTRLSIDYISLDPFMLRTHFSWYFRLLKNPQNNLVFLTRNPKELICRYFSCKSIKNIKIKYFIKFYINNFRIFEKWDENNKMLIFYEDLIVDLENNLLNILDFIGEEALYIDDFVLNKKKYLEMIRESYTSEYKKAGSSSSEGMNKIFYSKDVEPLLLKGIEKMLRKEDSYIYDKYLKRFEV